MIRKILALLAVLALAATMTACGTEKETTVTGMVTAIDGSVITLVEMDGDMGGKNFEGGERPSRSEGMEDFQGFGDFNPEDFEGTFPEGEFQPWGDGEMPEFSEGEMPQRPENGEMPQMPTGEDGEMQWPDMGEGMSPGFDSSAFEGETTQIDIGSAHISVEIDGGKEGGTLEDIAAGSFVTITKNSKGEVTNVLVSSRSGFGGFGGMGGFGGFGDSGDGTTEGAGT